MKLKDLRLGQSIVAKAPDREADFPLGDDPGISNEQFKFKPKALQPLNNPSRIGHDQQMDVGLDKDYGRDQLVQSKVLYKSPKYEQEVKILLKDPIIQKMAQQMKGNKYLDAFFENEGNHAANRTLDEYHKRGGKNASSIGGPFEAIKRLIQL